MESFAVGDGENMLECLTLTIFNASQEPTDVEQNLLALLKMLKYA
jgi:hypothetical protein